MRYQIFYVAEETGTEIRRGDYWFDGLTALSSSKGTSTAPV
jgi:hypothetical protein